MATFLPPLSKREHNIIYAKDGTVWCNYLLTGINVSRYDDQSVSSGQFANRLLFDALSHLPTDDILLLGVKSLVDPQTIMDRIIAGVPGIDNTKYPELIRQLNAMHEQMLMGGLVSYERDFWLSIAMPVARSSVDKVMERFAETDPHAEVMLRDVAEFEKSCFAAIPQQFAPMRTTPEHVDWIYDRARLRGLAVPTRPDKTHKSRDAARRGVKPNRLARPNETSYPEVLIDTAADMSLAFEDFVDEMRDDNPKAIKGRDSFRSRFRSAVMGRAMSISNVEERNPDFPDGYTSYQAMLGIARYPTDYRFDIDSLFAKVDEASKLDADFAVRITFDQSFVAKEQHKNTLRDVNAEDRSNSTDEFDADDYADRRNEVRDLREASRASSPRGMAVAVIFSFAAGDLDTLETELATVTSEFANSDFTILRPVGGQYDLWVSMMPGQRLTRLARDLQQVTTASLFSGLLPLRRSFVGDEAGVPIAVNEENGLGQIVLMDLLNATDRGNASVAMCGAQGAGKSNLMKLLLAYLYDLNRYTIIVDQHEHGEYEVFVSALAQRSRPGSVTVVDVTRPRYSMDILKLFPEEGAAQVFMDLWMPLLGLDEDSAEAAVLANCLSPEFRHIRRITTTRELLTYLQGAEGDEERTLARKLGFWASQDYSHALIDPVSYGQVTNLPVLGGDPRTIVFRTHELSVFRGEDMSQADTTQRWSMMVYTLIAKLSAMRFSNIIGPCAFIGDEMSFLKGSRVLEVLIRTPDRTGRKNGNFVIVGAQLAKDFDENYDLIKKKLIMRQETRANAQDALEWCDMPAQEELTDIMQTDISPVDKTTNRVYAGREGEGWFNDGDFIARVKTFTHLLPERRRMSDTTSSQMIRASELSERATADRLTKGA